MRGIGYAIGEMVVLLAAAGVVGVAVGWISARSRGEGRVEEEPLDVGRIEVLEHELRLAARHITEADQRAAEAERRLTFAHDTIKREERANRQIAVPDELTFGTGDSDRISKLEESLQEKTGSISNLEERLADQAEKMDRLLARIPVGPGPAN